MVPIKGLVWPLASLGFLSQDMILPSCTQSHHDLIYYQCDMGEGLFRATAVLLGLSSPKVVIYINLFFVKYPVSGILL